MSNIPSAGPGTADPVTNVPLSASPSLISTSQTSKLLSLPRELRDITYTYALTHEDNNVHIYRSEPYRCILHGSEVHNRCIRGEQIAPTPWNQFQFVNQQLRHETLGLELRLNTLVFGQIKCDSDYMKPLASVQFLGFLDMCSESWQQTIQTVRLEGASFLVDIDREGASFSVEENSKAVYDLHLVVYWCQLHPRTSVYLPIPLNIGAGQRHPVTFLVYGIMCLSALRPSLPPTHIHHLIADLGLYYLLHIGIIYQRLWLMGAGQMSVDGVQRNMEFEAANFRFLPDDGPFDEGAFREEMETAEGCEMVRRPEGEVRERWVGLVREWYEKGL